MKRIMLLCKQFNCIPSFSFENENSINISVRCFKTAAWIDVKADITILDNDNIVYDCIFEAVKKVVNTTPGQMPDLIYVHHFTKQVN